jgi:hypothetical protein
MLIAADEPSQLSVAAPFIVSAALTALGPFVDLVIEPRLKEAFLEWARADEEVNVDELISYAPETLARSSSWTIDAAQFVGMALAPLVGLLVLRGDLNDALTLFYVLAMVVVVAGFLYFVIRVRVDQYHGKGWWILTPVTLIGIGLNVAAALVAAFVIGP